MYCLIVWVWIVVSAAINVSFLSVKFSVSFGISCWMRYVSATATPPAASNARGSEVSSAGAVFC